jgi:transglutaminase-like putative cysteine protease
MRKLLLAACLCLPHPSSAATQFTAPTTVLYDDITYTVHWDASYSYEENVAVRLNTEEAVQDDGDSDIYYTGDKSTVKIIAAYTTTPAGQKIDVLPEKMLDQQGNADEDNGEDSYSDTARRTLIFPALVPGAVKTYHYIIQSTQPQFPGQVFSVENFPTSEEFQEASVTVYAPISLKLNFQPIGMTASPPQNAKPGQQKFTFTLHNLAAQPPEDQSVDVNDLSPRLEFTSFPTYAAAGAAYEQSAAPKAAVSPTVQQLADKLTQNIPDKRAQAAALYNWVSRNIRYVSVAIGDGGYVPNAADDIINAGYGDCKDHVTLLKALLAAKNIPSSGVLVNWGTGFFVPAIAAPEFNHIITYIPQFNLYVDSTAEFAPFGVLPSLERGKQALITGAPGIPSGLITLPISSQIPDLARTTTDETLNPDGSITGTSTTTDSGRYELDDREDYAGMQAGTTTQEAITAMLRIGEQGTGNLSGSDPYDLSKPFIYKSSFTLPGYTTLPGPSTMPIPAGVPASRSIAYFPYYFSLPTRTTPTPCLPKNIQEITTLHLPPHLTITSLPPNTTYTNPIGTFTATYISKNHTITRTLHLTIQSTTPTCSPTDYTNRRALSLAIGRDARAALTYVGG